MLKIMGISIFSMLVLAGFPLNSFSQEDAAPAKAATSETAAPTEENAAKTADIRRLMNITGGGDIGKQVIEQMLESFKASNPEIPATFWDDFIKEVDASQLVELNVPIYDKYLSHDDIKGIIAFYESPVGQKFIDVLPQIVQESYVAGQEWGYGIGTKLREKLEEKGYLKTEAAPADQAPAAQTAPAEAAPIKAE